jgi:hypothetical protein
MQWEICCHAEENILIVESDALTVAPLMFALILGQ